MRVTVLFAALSLAATSVLAASDSDLWGFWSFDDSTIALAVDASPNHNDATGERAEPVPVEGMIGLGRMFENGKYFAIPRGSSPTPDEAITVEAWIYLQHVTTYPAYIVSKEAPYATWGDFRMLVGADGYLQFELWSGNSEWTGLSATEPLFAKTWTHVAATFDNVSKECVLYYNGRVVASADLAGASLNADDLPLFIGRSGCQNRYLFYGRMDEFSIWSTVRVIDTLTYDSPVDQSDPSLWGHYAFEEAGGGIAFDGSSHHNDALPAAPMTAPGYRGSGRRFMESGALVVPATATPAPERAMTVEAWVYASGSDLSHRQFILSKELPQQHLGEYQFFIDEDSCLAFGLCTGLSTWVNLKTTQRIPADKWTHVKATFDNATKVCALYYDDSPVARGLLPEGQLDQTEMPLFIGRNGCSNSLPFTGVLDEVRISSSVDCCACPVRGNLDNSEDCLVTMSDLTVLVDHLFVTLAPLTCTHAANLDLSPDGLVTMSDLTILIDNLFVSLTPLSTCGN